MKLEELYRTNYKSEQHLRKSLKKYIEFYNNERPHSVLCNRTPNKVEAEYASKYGVSTDIIPDTYSSDL